MSLKQDLTLVSSVFPRCQCIVEVGEGDFLPVLGVQEEGGRAVAKLRQLPQGHRRVAVNPVVNQVGRAQPTKLTLPLVRLVATRTNE